MSEPNPYAPPDTLEPEAPTTRYWQVDGVDVIAKNGATLPEIDLETGSAEGPMKAVPRVYQAVGTSQLLSIALIIGAVLLLKTYYDAEIFTIFIVVFFVSVISRRLSALRGTGSGRILVWTFMEERRAKQRTLRRKLRIGAIIAIGISLFLVPVAIPHTLPDFTTWMLRCFGVGIALLILLAAWAVFDRLSSKTRSGPPGYLRICSIHPEALRQLQQHEQKSAEVELSRPAARGRLIQTAYLYRYPLRFLLGDNWKNPLIVINLALMKLMRSKLLVREVYHFSEAENITMEQVSDILRNPVESWLASHPDWEILSVKQRDTPTGDVTVQYAVLAPRGFEHCLAISHTKVAQKPSAKLLQLSFTSWLEHGGSIQTHDHPSLRIELPGVHGHRFKGTPEQLFIAHLGHCAGHPVRPCRAPSEVLEKIELQNEQFGQAMIQRKMLSEVHPEN